MKINCPNSECSSHVFSSPKIGSIVANGTFYRKSDSRAIQRYYCKTCSRHFSNATFHPACFQKKRRITAPLNELLCSSVSLRRAAKILRVDRKTVVRRFRYLASEARRKQDILLQQYEARPLSEIQFDDLETSEHTKFKPLSVSLAVEPGQRKILNFKVNTMPANGHLAEKARKKYGPRADEREHGWDQMMKELRPIVVDKTTFTSDENPHYPRHVLKHHPSAKHVRVPGGRGAVTGQGELKKLKFDPLFSLNHTCAMLRANLNRLVRKTWCTTKTKQGLIDHISLYVLYHNTVLTDS